ncbi:cytochrome c oxidase subunit II (mitochondrion) [Mercenaria mercenaria]|uniref:Cytochrome c oxidase subunit 2 n=1 Tax=Mercenaria mercenaria TaxID=6596 RepID=A0A6H0JR85_MERMC|nr:cytochrome c oxidase subunit II [Mercenaria mercenaria]QIU83226.1 cytochrome c oxidase subunit 2 [Mercenaria mercenaria]
MVLSLVGWFLGVMLMSEAFFGGNLSRFIYKNEALETFWTIVPAVFLGGLGFISLKNLYNMEVGDCVAHTVKVTGHQWYWEYQYELNFSNEVCKSEHVKLINDVMYSWLSGTQNNKNDSVLLSVIELFIKGDWFVKYDSYIVPESELSLDESDVLKFRNQWVDNSCLLACNKKNEVLVSTADVMHSWGVSELGVKADAVPGRSNALGIEPILPGVLFGNCYELCGEGHSQMPIVVTVSEYMNVILLLKNQIFNAEFFEEFLDSLI